MAGGRADTHGAGGGSRDGTGDVADVVFPCGQTLGPDGDTLRLYYGAADTVVGMASASLSEVLAWLHEFGEPGGRSSGSIPPSLL